MFFSLSLLFWEQELERLPAPSPYMDSPSIGNSGEGRDFFVDTFEIIFIFEEEKYPPPIRTLSP